MSKRSKLILIIASAVFVILLGGAWLLGYLVKTKAADLTPQPPSSSWIYNPAEEAIQIKIGDNVFNFKSIEKGTLVEFKKVYQFISIAPGIAIPRRAEQKIELFKNVNGFKLVIPGDSPPSGIRGNNMILALRPARSSNRLGNIVRIGRLLSKASEGNKIKTSVYCFFTTSEKKSSATLCFAPIEKSFADSLPEPYRSLYTKFISSTGQFDFPVNFATDSTSVSRASVPKEMVDACKDKLPSAPIKLSDPPPSLEQIFKAWNETFAKNPESKNKIPTRENANDNPALFADIIPRKPNQPVAQSSIRATTIRNTLNSLEEAINSMWNKSDIEGTAARQVRNCFVTSIATALGAGIVSGGTGAAAGFAASGLLCGGGSELANKLMKAMYGTTVPRYFAATAIAYYYDTKVNEYLGCLEQHPKFKDLPEELQTKIQKEQDRIQAELRSLNNQMQTATEQFDTGKGGFFEQIRELLVQTIRKLLTGILRFLWGFNASAPL